MKRLKNPNGGGVATKILQWPPMLVASCDASIGPSSTTRRRWGGFIDGEVVRKQLEVEVKALLFKGQAECGTSSFKPFR